MTPLRGCSDRTTRTHQRRVRELRASPREIRITSGMGNRTRRGRTGPLVDIPPGGFNCLQMFRRSRTVHHGMQSTTREREDILAHVLGETRTCVLTHPHPHLSRAQKRRYGALCARLDAGEPLAYILDEQWFYGRPFRVTRDVLIPRPETELLIDHVRAQQSAVHGAWTLVDIGTGSGCIAVTLAAELPKVHIIATDTSPAALRIARANARRHGVALRITFLRGDLLEPVRQRHVPPCVVIANLPYLTTAEWRALPSSIKNYEPRAALDGGRDGLAPYRAFFSQLRTFSVLHSACCILEIDPRRRRALAALVRRMLLDWRATFHRDLAGRWRVLELQHERRS